MSCSRCGLRSCKCGFVTQKPYFTDACQEQQGCPDRIYVCNFSTILRIQGAWAVPAEEEIVTLNVPGLTDILVGSIIWNPDYGSYTVVAIPGDEQIKVTRTEQNTVEAGTTILSCTKFMTSLPFEEVSDWVSFDGNWEVLSGSGTGSISLVSENNKYTIDGDTVNVSLNAEIEITTVTILGGVIPAFELPFQAAAFTELGQKALCRTVKVVPVYGTSLEIGVISMLPDSNTGTVTPSDLDKYTSGRLDQDTFTLTIQQNFFYKKGA